MIVGSPMTKQSDEKWPWSVDFADVLETDAPAETISTAVFTATSLVSSPADATDTIQAEEPVVSGSVVAVELQAGTPDEDYMLQLRVTTDRGHVWDAERLLLVRDIP